MDESEIKDTFYPRDCFGRSIDNLDPFMTSTSNFPLMAESGETNNNNNKNNDVAAMVPSDPYYRQQGRRRYRSGISGRKSIVPGRNKPKRINSLPNDSSSDGSIGFVGGTAPRKISSLSSDGSSSERRQRINSSRVKAKYEERSKNKEKIGEKGENGDEFMSWLEDMVAHKNEINSSDDDDDDDDDDDGKSSTKEETALKQLKSESPRLNRRLRANRRSPTDRGSGSVGVHRRHNSAAVSRIRSSTSPTSVIGSSTSSAAKCRRSRTKSIGDDGEISPSLLALQKISRSRSRQSTSLGPKGPPKKTLSLDVEELAQKGFIRVGEDGKLKLELNLVNDEYNDHDSSSCSSGSIAATE